MSCGVLTTGFDYQCDDSIGGISPGSILIAQFESITGYTATDGVITAFTQAASTFFYRYKIKKFISGAITTENHDPVLGTTNYETVLQTALNKLSAEKNEELMLLNSKPLVIIYTDMNGINHCIGAMTGAEKTGGTNTASTGTAQGDQNGYQIAFTAVENRYPFIVEDAAIAALDIVGEAS